MCCLVRDPLRLGWLEGRGNLAICQGDIADMVALRRAVTGIHSVYHLAGLTRALSARDYFQVNAEGTRNLLEACLEAGEVAPRLIYVSSLAAVGPKVDASPLREEASPRPVSAYGRSKLEGEKEILAVRGRLHVTILRPGVVYGPRDKGVLSYARWVKRGLLPMPAGRPRAISLCYIDDLVRAIIAAGEADRPSGEVYHVAGEGALTWKDFGHVWGEVLGVRPRPVRIPVSILLCLAGVSEFWAWATGHPTFFTRGKVREAAGHWVCDATKAKRHLGFIPCVGPKEGIARTIQWYRGRGWI